MQVQTSTEVNRVEVIDKDGRSYTNLRVTGLVLSYQDEGKTLKIFIEESQDVT